MLYLGSHAIRPNVRQDCVLTRPGPRSDQLGCQAVCDLWRRVLRGIVWLAQSGRPPVDLLLRTGYGPRPADFSPQSRHLASCNEARNNCVGGVFPCWAHTPSRAYAPPGSLASPPNCKQTSKPPHGHWASRQRANSADHSRWWRRRPKYRPFGQASEWLDQPQLHFNTTRRASSYSV